MLPSRGLARVTPGALSRNQLCVTSSRQFSTTLKTTLKSTLKPNGRPIAHSSRLGLMSSRGVGTPTLVSSATFPLANSRRFASTSSEPPSPPSAISTPSSDLPSNISLETLESILDDLPQKPGYLAQLGLDYGWGPSSTVEWVLEHAHFTAGLSWGWSIVAVAVVLRAAFFIPALRSQQESQKMQDLRKNRVYHELSERSMAALTGGGTTSTQEAQMIRAQMKILEEKAGLKKKWFFISALQIPFQFCAFKVSRAMTALPVPGLETAGFLWFTDLSVPDPYYILPCVSAVVLVLNLRRTPATTPMMESMMKTLPWIICPLGIVTTCRMDAGTTLFFAAGSFLMYLQTTLFYQSWFRKAMSLPPIKKSSIGPKKASYQAPRTIATKARLAAKDEKSSGILGKFKDSFQEFLAPFKEAMNKMSGTDVSPQAQRKKYQEEYERRRKQQEVDAYLARKNAVKAKKK